MSFVFCPPRLTTSQLWRPLHGSWLHHCTVYDTVPGTLATLAPHNGGFTSHTLYSVLDNWHTLSASLTSSCLHLYTNYFSRNAHAHDHRVGLVSVGWYTSNTSYFDKHVWSHSKFMTLNSLGVQRMNGGWKRCVWRNIVRLLLLMF